MTIRPTEAVVRELVEGQFEEIQAYINPVNDNRLAAWMMAVSRAHTMLMSLQAMCDTIKDRPINYIQTNDEATDAEMDRIENAHVHPAFAPILNDLMNLSVRPHA